MIDMEEVRATLEKSYKDAKYDGTDEADRRQLAEMLEQALSSNKFKRKSYRQIFEVVMERSLTATRKIKIFTAIEQSTGLMRLPHTDQIHVLLMFASLPKGCKRRCWIMDRKIKQTPPIALEGNKFEIVMNTVKYCNLIWRFNKHGAKPFWMDENDDCYSWRSSRRYARNLCYRDRDNNNDNDHDNDNQVDEDGALLHSDANRQKDKARELRLPKRKQRKCPKPSNQRSAALQVEQKEREEEESDDTEEEEEEVERGSEHDEDEEEETEQEVEEEEVEDDDDDDEEEENKEHEPGNGDAHDGDEEMKRIEDETAKLSLDGTHGKQETLGNTQEFNVSAYDLIHTPMYLKILQWDEAMAALMDCDDETLEQHFVHFAKQMAGSVKRACLQLCSVNVVQQIWQHNENPSDNPQIRAQFVADFIRQIQSKR
eukprot:CAMPEP_0202697002 /NCGR_PEP_ID=MMETSP1385-20130828/10334_1 /ASSEMBLY_ACC=CAM_ASM_000861 /TAXON_ID=933848 /ORGANISM="Elphidium margaritaceum" /LENGTH=427 /DNA_ID=CAMNT_0049353353 /DNA_START=35 /DNA_END=1318 /DNA_ORIENTATION=-